MMTRLIMTRDINGYNSFATMVSNTMQSMKLTQGVAQSITVPQTEDVMYTRVVVVITPQVGTNVWMAVNDTAAIPTGSASATTSELNSPPKYVKAGDVLSLITSDDVSNVGVVFYAVS